MLKLLGDVFRISQNVTDKEFLAKLEESGIEYTVRRIDTATCIEVGRFCYRFNERGQSRGGWITNCATDRRSEWQRWGNIFSRPQSKLSGPFRVLGTVHHGLPLTFY
jgi:hypothetical protein